MPKISIVALSNAFNEALMFLTIHGFHLGFSSDL